MRFYAVGLPIIVTENTWLGDRIRTIQQEELYANLIKSGNPIRLFSSFDDAKDYAKNQVNNIHSLFVSSHAKHPIFTIVLSKEHINLRGIYSELIKPVQGKEAKYLYFYNVPLTLISEKNVVRAEFYNSAVPTVEFNHNPKTNNFCSLFGM